MTLTADPAAGHQVGSLEHAEMLQHGRAIQLGEPGAELTRRARCDPQHIEDAAPGLGRFPVTVVEAQPPRRLVIKWDGNATADDAGTTTTTFEFEPIDGDTRTLVTITESAWRPTTDGATHAFGNCEGWTGMLAALKAWLEHGINLRAGFYK
jgi:uncharacterized protein YndB with AHSA1/START domain